MNPTIHCPQYDRFWEIATQTAAPQRDDLAWLDLWRGHALTCARCQAALFATLLVTESPTADAPPDPAEPALVGPADRAVQLAHGDPAARADIPDEQAIGAYVYLELTGGAAAAAARWPAWAAHIAHCPLCAAAAAAERIDLAALLEPAAAATGALTNPMLADATPTGTPPTDAAPAGTPPSNAAPVDAASTDTARVGGSSTIRQLAPRTILAGPGGLRFAGSSPFPGAPRLAARGATPATGQLNFTVDLRADDALAASWPRVELQLIKRVTGGVGCQMCVTQVRFADDPGATLRDIAWGVDHADRADHFVPATAAGRPQRGATDAQGRASWFVTEDGLYRLTVAIDDLTWQIPLYLTADLAHTTYALRGAHPMPVAQLQVWLIDRKAPEQHYIYFIPKQPGHEYLLERERIVPQQDRQQFERGLYEAASNLLRFARDADQLAGEHSISDMGVTSAGYLPSDVRAFLFSATTPLLIQTNDPTFPWEIVRDGESGRFLGTTRAIGRIPPANREQVRNREPFTGTPQVLIIESTAEDIVHVARECDAVTQQIGQFGRFHEVTRLDCATATWERLQRALARHLSILHYAGHVDLTDEHHAIAALHGPQGTVIGVADITDSPGTYGFVFLNGCQSGRVQQVSDPHVYLYTSGGARMQGLAQAFLDRGARAVVCTLWPVADDRAYQFADAFYAQLRQGVAVGEALRAVREAWRTQFPHDPTWAAYVLYGEPDLRIEDLYQPMSAAIDEENIVAPPVQILDVPAEVQRPRQADEASDGDLSADRLSVFLRRCASDRQPQLEPAARAALLATLSFVDETNYPFVARMDLLVGLAAIPAGVVARALHEQGVDAADFVLQMRARMQRGDGRTKHPTTTSGVRAAIAAAIEAGGGALTERGLAVALLRLPSTGTLRRICEAFHLDATELWHAISGTGSREPEAGGEMPSAVRSYHVPQIVMADKRKEDTQHGITTSSMLEELRHHQHRLRPYVERNHELREALFTLTDAQQPHLLIVGEAGVGKTALCWEIARRRLLQPIPAEVAGIETWDIVQFVFQPTEQRPLGPTFLNYLRDMGEDQRLKGPTIVVLDDLEQMLKDSSLAAALQTALSLPRIRLLATISPTGYAELRRAHPALARGLALQTLQAPRPEVAKKMVEAALPGIKADLPGVIYESGAIVAAIDRAARGGVVTLGGGVIALPGAAIELLLRAGASAIAALRPQHAGDGLATDATDVHQAPQVTAATIAAL